jgi:GcrA cell cycle regulator
VSALERARLFPNHKHTLGTMTDTPIRRVIYDRIAESAVDGVWTGTFRNMAQATGISTEVIEDHVRILTTVGVFSYIRKGSFQNPSKLQLNAIDLADVSWGGRRPKKPLAVKSADFDWNNPTTIQQLSDLWNESHSTAEIARRMGTTKNSVVGKAHRLGLPPRPSPVIRDGYTPRAVQPLRATGPTLPPLASIAITAEPAMAVARAPDARPRLSRAIRVPAPVRAPAPAVKVFGRVTECAWPHGEPGTKEFHFCNKPTYPGSSYCAPHHSICYVRVRDLREDYA